MINATKQAWEFAEKIAHDFDTTAFVIIKQCEKKLISDIRKYKGDISQARVRAVHVALWRNEHEE